MKKRSIRKKNDIAALSAVLVLMPAAAQAQPDSALTSPPSVYANIDQVENFTLSESRIVGGLNHASGARLMDPVTFDFNGDGIQDVIFGAPGMSPMGVSNAGSVYVVLGKTGKELAGRIDMTLWKSYDYRFDGNVLNGMLGMNIVGGDFNGDGIQDVAIAEPGQNGRVYVIYGGKTLPPGNYLVLDERVTDVYFSGSQNDSNLGLQMCVADFNHDDIDDLAAGYTTAYSIADSSPATTNVVLLSMRRSWDTRYHNISDKLYGKAIFSRAVARNVRAMYTCAAGDFDDDGLVDLALGMPLDAFDGLKSAGSVSIVQYPAKYSGTTVNLSETDPTWGVRIKGSQNGAMFGYSLAAGDFTGDGRTDLAVSAPNRVISSANSEGAVFILDANQFPKHTTIQSEDIKIAGKGGNFGYKLQSVDVNGDKRSDLVVSAPQSKAFAAPNAGTLNVYLGGPHFIDSVKNNMRPDVQINGDIDMNIGLGAAFGDFNGDGKIDVYTRAAHDPNGRANTGSLIAIHDVMNMTPDTHLSDVNFLTVVAPSQGGGISPKHDRVHYAGKTYDVWFSEGGLGNRSVICMIDTANSDKTAQLYVSDSCDINIIGPENVPIHDLKISSNSDHSKSWLTIALPSFQLSNAKGVVSVIELPTSIDKPLTLNLNKNTLASEAITFVLSDDHTSNLGSKISVADLDKDGHPDLVIGAPKRIIEHTAAGSVFIVKDIFGRKKGTFDLASAPNVITIEGIENENLGSDWQILDFNINGKADIAISAENTKNTNLEVYSTVYVIYDISDLETKVYTASSPELAPLKLVAPANRAGLKLIPQTTDINRDGKPDLLLISPNYRSGLQRQGAIYALNASKENKGGTLNLNVDALISFSLTSNRNEKLTDYRFVRHEGKLQLLTLSESLLTGQTTLRRLVTGDVNVFAGQAIFSSLTRVASDVTLAQKAQLLTLPDPSGKEDLLWIAFPHAGDSQSDQGIIHQLSLK